MFMNGHGKQINDYFQLKWKYRHTDVRAFRRLSVQDSEHVKIPNQVKHLQFISYTISLMLSQNLLLDQLKFLLNVYILIPYQTVFTVSPARFMHGYV